MKRIFYLIGVFTAVLAISCSHKQQEIALPTAFDGIVRDSVCVVQLSKSDNAEYLYVNFKILDQSGKKVFVNSLENGDISVLEYGAGGDTMAPVVDSIIDIRQKKVVSDKLSMLFLVDRSGSISQSVLDEQREQIAHLLEVLPNTNIYLSFMDSTVTASKRITKENFKEEYLEFKVQEGTQKYLYKAILSKMEELAGRPGNHYGEVAQEPALKDSTQKILFVFTDGRVVDEEDNFIGGASFFEWKGEIITLSQKEKLGEFPYIPIHCIYIGSGAAINDIRDEMEALCNVAPSRDALKGRFHTLFNVDKLQETLLGTIDSIAADYMLVLKNPAGKVYDGAEHKLTIKVREQNGVNASGDIRYSFGSQHVPIIVPSETQSVSRVYTIFIGILYGLLFVALAYVILQYLLPWIKYKIFCKKYIIKYRASQNGATVEQQHCYHCKEAFQDGDEIVVKCEHVVHLECWKENRNRCPEYGVHNCTKGIHYYNQERLSDPRNAPYFLMWLVYGLLAGLVSWVFMRLLYSETMFSSLITGLVDMLHPSSEETMVVPALNFLPKIQPLLLCGILLGFFITLFFSYQIEFRKKNLKIWGFILTRSLVGSLLGFLSFLIGSVAIIALGKDTNCIYTDWIPWAVFAVAIACTLSFKTDIKLKSALMGGLISVLISFLVLFIATFAKEILSMFSYMIYAAGFGIAIAVVHYVSEKYFLRVSGPVKERDIAIYKWMSVTGGFNRVTIGKSIDCILEMNWDDSDNIADKQVEIYLENDRPYCKALSDGTRLANGQFLQKNQVILLSHGTEFTIGNSLFTYIEKDK